MSLLIKHFLAAAGTLQNICSKKKEKGYNRDREERHEEEGGYSA
jgi:hypothetical protein